MHRLRATVASVATIALSVSLAAGVVAQDESAPADDELVAVDSIEGLTWLLRGQVVDGAMAPVPDRLGISLFMEGGDAGGNGGCNGYFTSYELSGSDLTFGPVGSTMMACLPPVMDAEQAYFANLGEVAAFESGDTQLALLDADGGAVLEFDLAPATTIVGAWVATGINNGNDAVETNANTGLVTASFDEDGQLSGSDGCNNYFTTYEVDGDAITIAPEIATTMMLCEDPGLAEISQQYFAALGNATVWSVDAAGNLELRNADGALQVGYAPAE